jgi:hypothetical protein
MERLVNEILFGALGTCAGVMLHRISPPNSAQEEEHDGEDYRFTCD